MNNRYNPIPPDAPVKYPRRVPERVVPSYIGKADQVLNLLMHRGAGDIVRDYSGEGNHGEITGAKWTDEHSASWTLSFDGSNDYVDVGDVPVLEVTIPFSISVWFNPDAWNPDNHDRLIDKGAWGGADMEGYAIASAYRSTNLIGRYGDDAGNGYDTVSSTTPSTGDWHHTVYVVESGNQVLYLDGESIASSAHTADIGYGPEPVTVGAQSGHAQYFDGKIGEVRIYDRALSDATISEHFENTKPIFGV